MAFGATMSPQINQIFARSGNARLMSSGGYDMGIQPPVSGDAFEGVSAGVNVGGLALQGRMSAAFLGVVVIAMTSFYVLTRRIQL